MDGEFLEESIKRIKVVRKVFSELPHRNERLRKKRKNESLSLRDELDYILSCIVESLRILILHTCVKNKTNI